MTPIARSIIFLLNTGSVTSGFSSLYENGKNLAFYQFILCKQSEIMKYEIIRKLLKWYPGTKNRSNYQSPWLSVHFDF